MDSVPAIPIAGYIYSPFEQIPNYAPSTRLVFVPHSSFRGFGHGKAMSFEDVFRKDQWMAQACLRESLTSFAFGDDQGDVVGLFLRAESSSLICNGCQQL